MPHATDEQGNVVPDSSSPEYVVTEAQHERWDQAVRIAQQISQRPISDVGCSNLAAAFFWSPAATHDRPERPERPTGLREESFIPPALLRRLARQRKRTRGGQFAEEFKPRLPDGRPAPTRPPVPPAPPRSPGTIRASILRKIEELGLNRDPEPSDEALAVLGGHEDTAERFYVEPPDKRDTRDRRRAHPPYERERQPVHDQAVGRMLAGLPIGDNPPTGIAELLGENHAIVQKLVGGGRLSDEEKDMIRERAAAAREGERPQALFTAGGPASGKSTALRNLRDQLRPLNAVTIDADLIKRELPEYNELLVVDRHYAAHAVHAESGDIAERTAREAMDLGLNIVFDGTGNREPGTPEAPGEFVQQLQRKREKGYQVGVAYFNAPTDEAIVRNVIRAEVEGRYVPIPKVRALHSNVSRTFAAEIQHLDWLDSLDIYEGEEKLATRYGDAVHAFNPQGYQAFLAKGRAIEEAMQRHFYEDDDGEESPIRDPIPPEDWVVWVPWDYSDMTEGACTYVDPPEAEGGPTEP